MSYAISVGLQLDAKDANRNLNQFRREIGFAKAATQDITGTIKVFRDVTKDMNLTNEQAAIVEARLVAAHERRTAKVKEATAAVEGWANGLARVNTSQLAQDLQRSRQGADAFAAGLNAITTRSRETAAAIRASQAAVEGWANGLRQVGVTQLAQDLQRSRQGADAFAAGLNAITTRSRETAAAIRASQAAVEGWANGLARVNTSQLAQDLQRSRQGADAFAAGLNRLTAQTLERDSAALEANIAARERHNAVLASGRQYMQQFETGQQRMVRQLREANAQFRAGAITQEQYGRATDAIRSRNNLLHQSFTQLRTAVTTLLGPLVLVYSAYRGFTESIKLSAELEQATAKFKVFTGSLREAEQTLAEIRELSRSSPVSFTGGQRAVTTMLQFGVASDQVVKSLRQVAEITGGDTQRMEALALAFGQANAAGRLMGQELLQMVNAGFNPLKVISDQTGRSMKDLKDAMAEGEISFQMVAQAFEDAVGPGGKFNGLLQEMANTTAGQLTRATNAVQELGIAFGDLLAAGGSGGVIGEFTAAVSEITLAVNTLRDIGKGGPGGSDAFFDARQFSLNGFEAIGQTIDVVKFGIAGARKDLFGFLEAYDRTVARLGKNNARDLLGRDFVNEIDDVKAALADLDAVRSKAVEDRSRGENLALAATDQRDRSAKDVGEAEYNRLLAQLKTDYAAAKTDLAKQTLFTEFVDKVGRGFINDGDLELYEQYRKEIEKANEAQKEQIRLKAVFQESIDKEKSSLLENRFGKDRAGNVELIRDQATGKERENINKAIANGADYGRIVRLASEEARAQLKTLEAIQAKNKAYEDAKEAQKQADKAAKEAAAEAERAAKEKAREDERRAKQQADELKKLKKQADEIRQAGSPFKDFIDQLSDAQLLNKKGLLTDRELRAERNRLASENVKNVTATAAPVASRGSQEAFQLITGQTVDRITRQLQEAEKQTILAVTAADVRKRTLDKLDELVDNKPAVVGP
jgi:tape measure domain-containing protein